ncbi:hypothetical protein GGTG_13431 [Gaeumannomyces tritici R3-111a-1]|uniref:Secreted protein n=1 Tax=Gaeumannomyces tritici (strain R3-111a-1) TaxID=644352 RepID=J3PIV1_GAET3|nr:hypothetical protein GGTG_13431 [Gaeumannomyces tritici R3-111a-1]EJT69034.1 hypothetical protein GGTG_13431 [Gaeumannomyces tritici R3-111a-1]
MFANTRIAPLGWAAAAILGHPASASIDDQAGLHFNGGTFEKPSSLVRPRFRYWLPDSSVSPDVVKADITAAGSIGAGGIELLPFFQYGGRIGNMPPGADWSISNFGTPQFDAVFRAALEAHQEHGMVMDFALGPNQGQGVPVRADDEGLQWDLVPFTAAVPPNRSFHGVVPGWGTGELVSVVSAAVASQKSLSTTASDELQLVNVTWDQYILRHGSLTERISSVDNTTGEVSLTLGAASNSTGYRLFAFYQKLTLERNLVFNATQDKTIFDNGSFVVDHFDGAGARVVARFWEDHILTDPTTKELLTKVGNYAWEDSVEITSNISWSKSLSARFQKVAGYRIEPFLPLLTFKQNNFALQAATPGPFECLLDSPDQGAGHVNDYHNTLADGIKDYLQTLTNWTNGVLKLQLSAQPGYNLPVDMLATIPIVQAPECESLGFGDDIDLYRHFTGPANLAGKRVISNELGAVIMSAYRYLLSELLFSANRGFAAGINQYVIHGQVYSGNYYATTWPGYTPFSYLFSELYSDKQPYWENGLADVLGYMGRTQLVQQSGVPRVDVAVYSKQSTTSPLGVGYKAADLQKNGWTYTYVSPANFDLPQATVNNGVLGPNGPAWKAIVIESTRNLTLSAASKVKEYAGAGLPVIFSGGSPSYYPEKDGGTNVHQVAAGGVAELLSSLGLSPWVKASSNGTWYTTWRESAADGIDYAFVLSDLAPASGEIVVASTKRPYFFDAWTGTRKPVLTHQQDETTTTIPLSMAGNQTLIIAFSDKLESEVPAPSMHITSAPPSVIGADFDKTSGISLRVVASAAPGNVSLSDGTSHAVPAMEAPPAFALTNWTLVAELWEAPPNLSDASAIASKRNTTHELPTLVPWAAIPALVNASGLGYYSVRFSWSPSNASATGAYLSLPGPIPNTAPQLLNAGSLPVPEVLVDLKGIPLPGRVEAGLVGEVRVIPFVVQRLGL